MTYNKKYSVLGISSSDKLISPEESIPRNRVPIFLNVLRFGLQHLGSYTRALLVSQDRRHLFVTRWLVSIVLLKICPWPSILSVCFLISEPCAGIFKQSMGARNRVGIELSYRPGSLQIHRLAELIQWNRFLGFLKVYKFELRLLHLVKSNERKVESAWCCRSHRWPNFSPGPIQKYITDKVRKSLKGPKHEIFGFGFFT